MDTDTKSAMLESENQELKLKIALLETQLQSLQRLPELDWARVSAMIAQEAASVARAGYQSNGQAIIRALDLGKVYVNRILSERDLLKKRLGIKNDH